MGMKRGKDKGKTKQYAYHLVLLKKKEKRGKEIKVYESLNPCGIVNHAVVSETLEHVYVLITAWFSPWMFSYLYGLGCLPYLHIYFFFSIITADLICICNNCHFKLEKA